MAQHATGADAPTTTRLGGVTVILPDGRNGPSVFSFLQHGEVEITPALENVADFGVPSVVLAAVPSDGTRLAIDRGAPGRRPRQPASRHRIPRHAAARQLRGAHELRAARSATGEAQTSLEAMDRMGCLVREMRREYPLWIARDSACDDVWGDVLLAYRDTLDARERALYDQMLRREPAP